ncbi:MAG TPA: hypothetical protein VGJ70_10130 [Solirubrobacteraceae bacterium]|jgi:hypothetical protein
MEQPPGPELTIAQARAVYAIRRRHPGADLTFHERPWGFILELTKPRPSGGRRVVGLARFAVDGSIRPDMPLPLAPPYRAAPASWTAQVSDSTS